MLKVRKIPQPFEGVVDRMREGTDAIPDYQPIPENPFFDLRYVIAPYNNNRVPLQIVSDVPDRVVNVKIRSSGYSGKVNPLKETTVYLQNLVQTFLIDLDQGPNYIVITAGGESDFIIVNCTRYGTFLYSFAQEYYNNVISVIDEQETAIKNKYATRLAEPLLSNIFYLLPSVRSLQMLSTRLVLKVLAEKSSYEVGVREMGAALTLNTPFIVEPVKNNRELDFVRYPWFSYAEFMAGKIAHLWIPNVEIVRWKAFATYVDNLNGIDLVDLSENEIIIRHTENGIEERHVFDFEKEKNYFARRRYAPDIYIVGESNLPINFIAPGYPFDMVVDEDHLLGNDRETLDMGIPFDSGLTFDSELFDSEHDGYLGLSLIDRCERTRIITPTSATTGIYPRLTFDSTRYPAVGSGISELVFDKGYYCKTVELESIVSTVDYAPTVSGEYDP